MSAYEIDLIASQLLGRDFADEIFTLSAKDFTDPLVAELFDAIRAARKAGKTSLDVFAAREWLDVHRPLTDIDAQRERQTRVLELMALNSVPYTPATLVAKVLDDSQRRKLRDSLVDVLNRLNDTVAMPTYDDVVAAAMAAVDGDKDERFSEGVMTGEDIASLAVQFVSDRFDGKEYGTPTGFTDLDAQLGGGLHEGELIVIAGRPAMGKTTLAFQIGAHMVATGGRVLFVSREMTPHQVAIREMSRASNIAMGDLMQGKVADEEWDGLTIAANVVASRNALYDFRSRTVSQIRAEARRAQRQGGLSCIVVDYLSLLWPEGKSERRDLEVGAITNGLKDIAVSLKVPVVILSQLNRNVEARPDKRPMMSDLRESGSIEQDADVVIGLYRDEYYNADSSFKGMAEAIVLKQRMGMTGPVPLAFDGAHNRFRNCDRVSYAFAKEESSKKPAKPKREDNGL